ncbi:MAG: aminotransferase class V-fold PLP-dependent enzyme [Alphaproteobacteria bacterium]|nr:aminotransferase class V-fold PLP-dependent enzyme [Alphaproteobacteria bacterium]
MDRKKAAREWDFGGVDYMNHGSFGACPRAVKEHLRQQQAALLRNPMEYFANAHVKNMNDNRSFWGGFIGADVEDVVHMECATQAVNTVLKSLALRRHFESGDEILITSHGYNACNNVAREIAELTGAAVSVAKIPFPVEAPAQVTEAVMAAVTKKTRFALIDHITSETALVFPVRDIVRQLKERGVETLVDGAHAPAHVPINVGEIGAAFYCGNGHKWLCAAPGCAFLYVRNDFHDVIRPLVTSHGANDPNPDISAFQKSFAWTGTRDTTPLSTPKIAFETLTSFHREGLPGLIADNMRLVRCGYRLICDALNMQPQAHDEMTGMMVTIPLPPCDPERLRRDLREKHNFMTQL